MITAAPSEHVTVVLDGAAANLAPGALTVALHSLLGEVIAAPSSVGVSEIVVGGSHTGVYTVDVQAPATPGGYVVVWDDGTVLSPYMEDLVVGQPVLGDVVYAHADDTVVLTATLDPAAAPSVALIQPPNTVKVEPVDVTVVELPLGSYTATLTTPAETGEYVVIWFTAVDAVADILRVVAKLPYPPEAAWRPTLAKVGTHLSVRTRDSNGNELGTFTAETRPSDAQVAMLIDSAASKVSSKIGNDLPPALWEKARTVTALRTAMLVELSYFGDQISAGRSPYSELKLLHDEEWKDLYSDWRDLGADLEPGTADDTGDGGLPAYSFPPLGPGAHAPGSELPADFSEPIW